MNPEQEHYAKASDHSEAFAVETEKTENLQWLQELVSKGMPIEIDNARTQALFLQSYLFDECIPEEVEAKAQIEKAMTLFISSYEQSVAFTVDEANRILELYPNAVQYEDRLVVRVGVVWQLSGEAILEFHTQQT